MDDKIWAKKIAYKIGQSMKERESRIAKLKEMIKHEESLLEDDQSKIDSIKANINNLTENFLYDI